MRTWRGSASGSWHQVSEGKEEWCCDGNDRWTSVLHRWSLDTWPPSAAWAGTARPQPDHQQQQPTTVWRPLYWSTCVRQHLQLRTGGFCSCTSAFGLGRDAGVLLNSVTCTVSVPDQQQVVDYRLRSLSDTIVCGQGSMHRLGVCSSVHPSDVCLSQHGPSAAKPLLQVCSRPPGRQKISIDCCMAYAWSANAGSATLSAHVAAGHRLVRNSLPAKYKMLQQQQRPFNGLWSGTTRVGRYQKERKMLKYKYKI